MKKLFSEMWAKWKYGIIYKTSKAILKAFILWKSTKSIDFSVQQVSFQLTREICNKEIQDFYF